MLIKKKKPSVLPIRIFGSIFMLVGLIVGGLGLRTFIRTQSASSWPSTPCTITHLEIVSSRSSDSTTYRLRAKYHYTVNGEKYFGNRVDFSFGSDSNKSYWTKLEKNLQRSKKKNKAICYYNPDKPEEAILIREPRIWSLLFTVGFGLVFCIAGGCVSFGVPALMRLHKKREDNLSALATNANDDDYRQRQPLPVTSLKMTAGFFTFFALFWNAISWFAFTMFLIDDDQEHGTGATLIVGLFPLIGVFMIIVALVMVGKWLRQRGFEYSLAKGPIPAGGNGELHLFNLPKDADWRMQVAEVRPQRGEKNRTLDDHFVLWSYDLNVRDDEVRQADSSIRLPIALPADARNSTSRYWQLTFTSKATGKVCIPLPIADGEAGPLTRAMITDAVNEPDVSDHSNNQKKKQIIFKNDAVILHTSWRNGFATRIIGTVFGLIFVAVGLGAGQAGAPLIFPLIFSGVGGLIAVAFAWHLGASSSFTIDQHGLNGWSRSWIFKKNFDLRPPGFSACQARSNMSSGNIHYFTISIEHAGQKVTVLRHYTDQTRLRRAVETIRKLLEIDNTDDALVITTDIKRR